MRAAVPGDEKLSSDRDLFQKQSYVGDGKLYNNIFILNVHARISLWGVIDRLIFPFKVPSLLWGFSVYARSYA